jgi:tetratricopeptide (TPR) repeat protein
METRLGQSDDSKGRILNSSMMNAEKAVAECAKLSADTARYYTDWISMNFLTEQLLNAKRFEEARILGEYNATTFSNKDLVMLTLGNVYRALHRTEEAIKYYKKTLEITPDYIEAKNCLQELGSIKK